MDKIYILFERKQDTLVYITFGKDELELNNVKSILESSNFRHIFEIRELSDGDDVDELIRNADALNKKFL